MKKKQLTKFQQWAQLYGITKLADRLGVSRQLVHQWVSYNQRPSDRKKIEIVELAGGILDFNDFFPPGIVVPDGEK